MTGKKMEWTDALVAHLRQLWADGLSTAEIGRQLGMTKNAVVGKAHRLKLSARPSPIKREKNSQLKAETIKEPKKTAKKATKAKPAVKAKKTVVETTPELDLAPKAKSAGKATTKAEPKAAKIPAKSTTKSAAKAPKKAPKSSYESVAAKGEKSKAGASASGVREALVKTGKKIEANKKSKNSLNTCQWPLGDPGTPEFHYCEEEIFDGKPYCLEHCAIAYVRLRERR